MAENTKTGLDRDVYISDEAFRELKRFLELKYKDKLENIKSKYSEDLVFSSWKTDKIHPIGIYGVLHKQFVKLLRKIEMAQRKDGQGTQRRKISFHLFRDYVKTTVSKHTTKDFSEWMLGHSGSTYWNVDIDDEETKELYRKCMKYLTYLDYDVVEVIGADFESKLAESQKEIEALRDKAKKYEESQAKLKELVPQIEGLQKYQSQVQEGLQGYKELIGKYNNLADKVDTYEFDNTQLEGFIENQVKEIAELKREISKLKSKK